MESFEKGQYVVSLSKNNDGMATINCINPQNKNIVYEKSFNDCTNMFECIRGSLNDNDYDIIEGDESIILKIMTRSDLGEQKIKIVLGQKVNDKSNAMYVVALEKEISGLRSEVNGLRKELALMNQRIDEKFDFLKHMLFEYGTNICCVINSNGATFRDLHRYNCLKIYKDRIKLPYSNTPLKVYYNTPDMLEVIRFFPNVTTLEIYTPMTDLKYIDKNKVKWIVLENTNIKVSDLVSFPKLEWIRHDSTFEYSGNIKGNWEYKDFRIERI